MAATLEELNRAQMIRAPPQPAGDLGTSASPNLRTIYARYTPQVPPRPFLEREMQAKAGKADGAEGTKDHVADIAKDLHAADIAHNDHVDTVDVPSESDEGLLDFIQGAASAKKVNDAAFGYAARPKSDI